MAQSPATHAATSEIIRYDLGWNAINALLRAGRSLSGHERNCCFLNTGSGRFADVSAAAGLDFIDDGRVLALADWDYDGDVDFWIANRSGPQVRYVRNDSDRPDVAPEANHFVAFALEGVHCNRDAIGARVTLHLGDHTPALQTRTLHAGDGYLSQSSKWLHFGLGAARRIDRVVVRWPGGREQVFETLDADRWYRLREDDPRPRRWQPPTDIKPLTPSEFVAPPVSDRARIVLLKPVPLPELIYRDGNGQKHSLSAHAPTARLVNLWASWCQPCLEELAEWRRHADELERAGLRVVTVNLDEHDGDSGPSDSASVPAAVTATLDRLRLPFENGFGSEELAAQFDVVQRSFLSRQRPLPMPSSFLIDSEGRLRVLYKGPVSAKTLLRDARLLDAQPAEILAAATPFQGQWHAPPGGSGPLQIALKFIEGGYTDDARQYIVRLVASSDPQSDQLSAGLLNLLGALSLHDQDYEQAVAAFSHSLALDPQNRKAHMELGGIRLRLGQGAAAAPHFEQVLEGNPDDPEMLYNLGMARKQQGDLKAAERHMREVLRLGAHPQAHWQLGDIHVGLRDAGQAIAEYESALRLRPELIRAANNLAWLLATIDDDGLRDGERAVEIAESIRAAQENPKSSTLDTLAAAYAEAARFEDAQRTAEEAIALATAENNDALAARSRQRLELYRQRLPFHASLGP